MAERSLERLSAPSQVSGRSLLGQIGGRRKSVRNISTSERTTRDRLMIDVNAKVNM